MSYAKLIHTLSEGGGGGHRDVRDVRIYAPPAPTLFLPEVDSTGKLHSVRFF